eukprot:TRINITY_DN8458_c0_g1_i1.p1 TRINITY_DN8458_c0_g1~~TRINITY_DN8458_c0_g1_i1.p1  ORF type:complete len:441 (+),score=70.98 TRINITY_DN8458_c0_g1_i1:34-1323(+)
MESEYPLDNEAPEEKFGSFVAESAELNQLIKTLMQELDQRTNDKIFERITTILGKYQEQPQLLDPHMEHLVTTLMSLVRQNFDDPLFLSHLCKIIYVLAKVRGYKTVEKFFPHEVADFEPTLQLIQKQDQNDFNTWETRYVLLLWFSVLVLLPFDISRIDSNLEKEPLIDRIVSLGKSYLRDSGKTREAAAILLSRALTRPDFGLKQLPAFLAWCNEVITAEAKDTFLITGVVNALAAIFMRGKRQELLDKIPMIYENLNKINSSSATHRKLYIKLIQRIGLTFMKPRIARWRYQRGNRSLLQSLGKAGTKTEAKEETEDDDLEEDIPEEIEDIIGRLLEGLKDKDTVVRWSAAKGIGRITNNLPKALGDEIVASVLELFSIGEGDSAWHGGCLALAELSRRGLLLPKRLEDVVPLIVKVKLHNFCGVL